MSSTVPHPGHEHQSAARSVFRALGPMLMLVALVLMGWAIVDFFAAFSSDDFDAQPTKFWMFFLALPFFVAGGAMIQAGFLGAAARYAAGETMPVVKDSAAYLTDGRGLAGIGRTEGPYCRGCGVRNDAEARFCDGCGQPLA
jgi:hypothetical protein